MTYTNLNRNRCDGYNSETAEITVIVVRSMMHNKCIQIVATCNIRDENMWETHKIIGSEVELNWIMRL